MPDIPVIEYALSWRAKDNKGGVLLILHNGQKLTIPCESAQELAAMAAILNESPVRYRTEDGALFTGSEPVGGTG
jgi:hypothetical protein